MSDIAAHLANAIERDVGQPVFLDGTRTDGSIALQFAVDRPDLVRRLVPLLAACASGVLGNDGDCNARIRYEGTTRPHNALDDSVPTGADSAPAMYSVAVTKPSAPKVDEVTVYAVKNVPRSIAVKSRGGDWEGTYVAAGVPLSEWPTVLRRP